MNLKGLYLLFFSICFLLIAACLSSNKSETSNNHKSLISDEVSLQGLIDRYPSDNHRLNKNQVETLMSYDRSLLLHQLRKIFGTVQCTATGKIPSQHAVILAGVYGGESFREGIVKTWQCDQKYAKETSPCEYYCSYKFVLKYLDISSGKEKPSPFEKGFYIENQFDQIALYLDKYSDSQLIRSIQDKMLHPYIPEKILCGTAANCSEHVMENNYRFAVFYLLGMRGKTEQARDFLIKEMLCAYGFDASGDGIVNFAEDVLYQIAYRLKNR